MYPLGKQFEIDGSKAKSDDKCIYKGNHYRITVLSERLVRLEYSPSGIFVDVPSQFVMNRSFMFPEYQTKQDEVLQRFVGCFADEGRRSPHSTFKTRDSRMCEAMIRIRSI